MPEEMPITGSPERVAMKPSLAELVTHLTLDEKVKLLTGRDFWTTWPMEKIGLRRILVSDGPSGVRGEVWDERDPSLNLPSTTALASTWDRTMARRYGAAAAVEARRKSVDVVLGPTINLHRSPLGGRHFEAFSEDPVLTAELATSYVDGVQQNGVGATPKHYVANDSETDRYTVDSRVDERALRELYLYPFEKTVVNAGTWAIMSAYNSINGVTATENELLETPLNSEWGFDGVVISDWTAVRSLNSARASQDLVMPGPDGPWGDALVAAVRSGEIDEGAIDRKVLRLLLLAERVGALDGHEPVVAKPVEVEDGVAFAREAAAAGTVMLTNHDELPWNGSELSSVAVIGHNAALARSQGGGSATVLPERTISPLTGIREALPDARVDYAIGAVVQEGIAPLAPERLVNPVTGGHGVRIAFCDAGGEELFVENRLSTALVWFGGDAPISRSARLDLETTYTPDETGKALLGFAAAGSVRIWVDGALLVDAEVIPEGTDLGAAFSAPSAAEAIELTEGVPISIRVEYDLSNRVGPLANTLAITIGIAPDGHDADRMIQHAVQIAETADVAIVVVGTNARVESEGYDRTSLELPGRQDELVRAVASVNRRTVVVVNAGSPVLLPWRDEVAAVLVGYFGGQEFGHAVADVLLGIREPGGRLPTTWPATEADIPVYSTTPENGRLEYAEGIHIGYRAWLRSGREPAFPFGHGLGYTAFAVSDPQATPEITSTGHVEVSVEVANVGDRAGKHVVQVYAERLGSAVDRPVRWLVAFAPIRLEAGVRERVTVTVPARAFAYWHDEWQYEAGEYTLRIGSSVVDLPLTVAVRLQP